MNDSEKIAVLYHSLFNYKLSKKELRRWRAGPALKLTKQFKNPKIRTEVKVVDSRKKMLIAKEAAKVLAYLPTILFVGITGSLAMNNAKPESDIDLMIITKNNTLWLTRPIVIVLLTLRGFKLRRAKNKEEEDKLCLNFWIDESSFSWLETKNAYIAHEISQVIPLINKDFTYERWIAHNSWIKKYWPNATSKVRNLPHKKNFESSIVLTLVNLFCFCLQLLFMSRKKTRETALFHKAYFHPFDWADVVLVQAKKVGVCEDL